MTFFVKINKQVCFVKIHPARTGDYFSVGNRINSFVKVTTRDTEVTEVTEVEC